MRYEIENKCHFKDIAFYITKELSSAKESIKICVAWINFRQFESVLMDKIKSGVQVQIICNDDHINSFAIKSSILRGMKNITFVTNPINRLYMHHKFCIIDDSTLITGSYNWSTRAALHYENIVIIKNDFRLVRQYKHEFADLLFMGSMDDYDFKSAPVRRNTSKFNLGTYSASSGSLEIVRLDIWAVSLIPTKTAVLLNTMYVPHFNLSIEIDTSDHYLMDDKEAEIDLYNQERWQIEKMQNYFDNLSIKIHAYGTAVLANEDMYLEYNEPPEPEIYLNWIDMIFKKVLPSSFAADGDFERIWDDLRCPD